MIPMKKKVLLTFLLAVLLMLITSVGLADKGTVTASKLMLRAEAHTEGKALQTLPEGTILNIIEKTGNWYKVTYGKYTGYVYAKYVKVTKESKPNTNTNANTNTTNQDTLREGARGNEVTKLQKRLRELGYFDAACTGYYGDITCSAVKAFQKKNGLTANGIANAATLKKVYASSAVKAKESSENKNTDVTLQQGSKGDAVKKLQQRLKELGYFNRSCTGIYGSATCTAVKRFQERNGLNVDGIAGAATQKKVYSSSAKKPYITEKLDWFKRGVYVFPGRAIVEVKDVRTGLTFKARVLYGTNHLDVEPLTKEDTAILLKMNGGVEFSWHRRPTLVKYNGHVYAASIYSEPHGEQTIYDNNFDGQFCLHFYGSKTHGTNEVKQDHQACVAEAMKATW